MPGGPRTPGRAPGRPEGAAKEASGARPAGRHGPIGSGGRVSSPSYEGGGAWLVRWAGPIPARAGWWVGSALGDRASRLWASGRAGTARRWWGWPGPGRTWRGPKPGLGSRALRPSVPNPAGLGTGRRRREAWWGPPGWVVRSVFGTGAGAFGGYAAADARLSRATGSAAPAAGAPPTRARTASTSAASTRRARCGGTGGVLDARCAGPVCHGRSAVPQGGSGCGLTSGGRAGRRRASVRGGARS